MSIKRYRSYRLQANGDDCLAIKQAILRKLKSEDLDQHTLIVIDGGKGQLRSGLEALKEKGGSAHLISIAKGKSREWGKESFYRVSNDEVQLFDWPEHLLKYILHIRDEAHQFAIKAHRRSMRKVLMHSELDGIVGLGKKRKKMLLAYFGGLEGVKCAKLSEINQVPGFGNQLSKRVYEALHIE